MRQLFAVVTAFLAAALAPALVFAFIYFALGGKDAIRTLALAFSAALLVTFVHSLILGLPVAAWLLRSNRFKFRTMLLAGFVIGVVPVAIWARPYKYAGTEASSWSNGVQKLNNGIPTLAGWLDYLQLIAYAGALGALGGMAFYLVYKGMCPNNSFKPNPHRCGA